MKIAITTSGTDLKAPLDSRFGRAAAFLIYDLDSDKFTVVSNQQNLQAAQGAGIQAAETVADQEVDALITGNCGPKAFRVLQAADIKVYNCSAATVEEALQLYRKGELKEASDANVAGHWN
ncbi:MAG: NifB/NifX family molybdenum-iron cluster-binding protein [Lentisphaeria bacterium]|mgnify:CR=1 FL=1|nr:NifB/NifX family molybdenum-iron cluster-binding protein [Lentisphaeria bacterium]MDY0175364.1 NifB/NifX family molybdenum-iron cluster-binding protein [Lentisphaeria bacterium]NLZ60852.1 dinitrogenase iron-molybdenum cofactor biosynthesis protein [Lentisphaerota bacterium]